MTAFRLYAYFDFFHFLVRYICNSNIAVPMTAPTNEHPITENTYTIPSTIIDLHILLRKDFMDILPLITAVLSAVISAWFTNVYAEQRDYKRQQSQLQATRLAICIELQAVLNLYESFKLSPDEPKNGDDIKAVRISYKYNTVYSHNADKLGLMDKKVIESVVTAYTYLASFIDTLTVLADRWEEMIQAERLNQDTRLYWQDVKDCHKLAYAQQETTLGAIHKAIAALREDC